MNTTPNQQEVPTTQQYALPKRAHDRFVGMVGPSQRTANWLWLILVVGCVVVLIASVVGIIVLSALGKKLPDGLYQVIIGVGSGLLGLFVGSTTS